MSGYSPGAVWYWMVMYLPLYLQPDELTYKLSGFSAWSPHTVSGKTEFPSPGLPSHLNDISAVFALTSSDSNELLVQSNLVNFVFWLTSSDVNELESHHNSVSAVFALTSSDSNELLVQSNCVSFVFWLTSNSVN